VSDAAIFVPNYKQVRRKEQVKVKVKVKVKEST